MIALCVFSLLFRATTAGPEGLNWHISLPQEVPLLKAIPFDLNNVRLSSGSFWYQQQDFNRQYLLALNSDSLLWNFRTTAGLAAPGTPYTGGWEDPTCELRGHFVGHWLSASALMWASTNDADLKTKMTDMVTELGKCQTKIGTGYLSAFPTEEFDRLEAHIAVWAPYYTIHKIMAGLVDQYSVANNTQALTIVVGMANYFYGRIQKVLSDQGMEGWQRIMAEEWGGMNDVMYSIYGITQDPNHLAMANLFDHYDWSRPLAAGIDDLNGEHANTHIPEIIGNQRAYEVANNVTQQNISLFFYTTITQHHSWATGGSNDYEYWGVADQVGDSLNLQTEESCTQYNILKVARHIFTWTADPRYFDFYEKAILNGIVGNQKAPGTFIYMMPLGAPGQTKGDNGDWNTNWGNGFVDFWCCYGTMLESFSKFGDSIYFYAPDSSGIYVNQFIPSTVTWTAKNVTLVQKTDFPVSDSTTLTITASTGSSWTLNIRVPSWTTSKATITVNGQVINAAIIPGTYVSLTQNWVSGNSVVATFPMNFWAENIQDNRPQYNSVSAFFYGPLLLAGLTSSPILPVSTSDFSWFTRTSTTALTFNAHTQSGEDVSFIPLLNALTERYTTYFNTSTSTTVQ